MPRQDLDARGLRAKFLARAGSLASPNPSRFQIVATHAAMEALGHRHALKATVLSRWIAVLTSLAVLAAILPGAAPVETGPASWYGEPYHGRRAASGEIYDMEQLTAAHRTLPFGTIVRVRRLDNRQSVVVRINDRGPFIGDRIIDLSHAAARALNMVTPGVVQVALEILSAPPPAANEEFAVQIGAFADPRNVRRVCDSLRRFGPVQVVVREPSGLSAVVVGRLSTQAEAESLAWTLRTTRPNMRAAFVLRLDPPAVTAGAVRSPGAAPQPAFPAGLH